MLECFPKRMPFNSNSCFPTPGAHRQGAPSKPVLLGGDFVFRIPLSLGDENIRRELEPGA